MSYQCDFPGCTRDGVVYDQCVRHAPDSWIEDALEEDLIDEADVPEATLDALDRLEEADRR